VVLRVVERLAAGFRPVVRRLLAAVLLAAPLAVRRFAVLLRAVLARLAAGLRVVERFFVRLEDVLGLEVVVRLRATRFLGALARRLDVDVERRLVVPWRTLRPAAVRRRPRVLPVFARVGMLLTPCF